MCRRSSNGGRRPAWMNEDTLTELKRSKEAHKKWKKGQVTQEEYRENI